MRANLSTRRCHTKLALILGLSTALVIAPRVGAIDPWPAEPITQVTNLTHIEGDGTNDFYNDLSGAVWNPLTRTLWVCRNGPGGAASKIWALVEDGAGSFKVDSRAGLRAEWTSFGDLEGITQANFAEDTVYVIIEGQERIKEYDLSVYGTAVLRNDWDTRSLLPLGGSAGAEAITFVPDAALAAAGFVDKNGNPYLSRNGMNGLMFVGHQNGGRLYVFDLNRANGSFNFVGEYKTAYFETAGLEFDRSTGLLYVWHDSVYDTLETLNLTSIAVSGQSYRQFNSVNVYTGPDSSNNEGIAIMPIEDATDSGRSFFMTVDDGGANSLCWYKQFSVGVATEPGCRSNAECDDGVFCNGAEQCAAGVCQAGTAVDCDDSVGCTEDACNEALDRCDHVPNDGRCDNGKFCDGPETCTSTGCQRLTTVCDGELCDETNDRCVACLVDSDCDDGAYCNGGETCTDGACSSGSAPCGERSCDEASNSCFGCLTNSECDDGGFCNGTEQCVSGTCQAGTAVDCNDSVGCTDDACNEALDRCDNVPNDGRCDNGVFCDGPETCTSTGCRNLTNVCDGQLCDETNDRCVTCLINSDCDDGAYCNGGETCVDGACSSGSAPCGERSCDEASNSCFGCLTNSECDDGVFCNGAEQCVSGTCQLGSAVDCDDNIGCTDDACNETLDRCDSIPNDGRCDNGKFCDGPEVCTSNGCRRFTTVCDGQLCDETNDVCVGCLTDSDCEDGSYCNGPETCLDGVCESGSAPCGEQSCDEVSDSCFGCVTDSECDDGVFCNGPETCLDGVCESGSAPCGEQSCDEVSDSCFGCVADSDCDDGSYCNGAEVCSFGQCLAGTAVVCDDNIRCTDDSCNESLGACAFVPNDGRCDNRKFCDGPETCSPTRGCQRLTSVCVGQLCDEENDVCVGCLLDVDCDDGSFCNGAETCVDGVCMTEPPPCGLRSCDELLDKCFGCLSDSECDDGVFCNGDELCVSGQCEVGKAVDCDDNIGCTDDVCNEDLAACENIPNDGRCDNRKFCDGPETCSPTRGCQRLTSVCDGQMCDEANDVCVECLNDVDCDDASVCTTNICFGGYCETLTVNCSDGDPCSVDSCDPVVGCMSAAMACGEFETCVDGTCQPLPCNNDGKCDANEDCVTCAGDCIRDVAIGCGNGWCEPTLGEDCLSCPSDCAGEQLGKASNRFCCGDGDGVGAVGCGDSRCSSGSFVCVDTLITQVCCGDGVCDLGEDSCFCERDCGGFCVE